MEVLHVGGSPRKKGNSMTLVTHLLQQLEGCGAKIQSHILNEMNYKGCQGCYACKMGSDHCVLEDDLTPVLEAMYEIDLLILSTPVYFADITGQMKCFVDRWFSFAKPDYSSNPDPSRLAKGKTLIFVQSQGAGDDLHRDIFEKYSGYFKMSGFEKTHLIRACGKQNPEEIKMDKKVLNQVKEIVGQLF